MLVKPKENLKEPVAMDDDSGDDVYREVHR